ncbi:MAG: acyl-CoA dehydrogenase family protein [Nocardioides marinisabuli]|uniref:acyl-CoA dehydrogenase family protein n=1 Tax=Nocardioides marinisabuli TaxID=419476 RepID=UPI0032197EF0
MTTPTPPPAPDLDLLATDVETDLRRSVRAVLAKTCTTEALTALADGTDEVSAAAWSALAGDLGLAALLVPEEHGGAGAGPREAAVVAEECGRACAPVPFLTSAVLATDLLVTLGATEALGRLAESGTAALVVPAATRSATGWSRGAPVSATGGRLVGDVRGVVGLPADLLLVPVAGPDGPALHLVEAGAEGVALTAVTSLDATRPLTDVHLDVPLDGAGSPLATGEKVTAALDHALATAAGLLAAEQAGLAAWCLEQTVAHLSERRQFGRVVGGFQALKHRLADLYAEVGQASAVAAHAAAALAEGTDVPVSVAVAQAFCSEVAVHAAEEAVQLHGGLGMTWESPVHLRLKRAKADHVLLGSPDAHRDALATLVDLTGPEAG